MWTFFARVALDVEATKTALNEAQQAKVEEATALLQQAEHEALRVREKLARIERDYRAGAITAEQWSRRDAKLTADLEAVEA